MKEPLSIVRAKKKQNGFYELNHGGVMRDIIMEVLPSNLVQIVTDNTIVCKVAGFYEINHGGAVRAMVFVQGR